VSADVVIGDWGSSRLRLWRLSHGEATERRTGPGILECDDPAGVLAAALADWEAEKVILCGMAGARGGLREVAYADCPLAVEDWKAASVRFDLSETNTRIAAGTVCRDDSGRADVMRGEETQIFGAMASDPSLAGGRHPILLPGTHSKWVSVEQGRIVAFRTFITGELFALLGKSSLLASPDAGESDEGFADGIARAGDAEALTAALFEARTAQLVGGKSAGWARGFVSGLLIGSEIGAMGAAGRVTLIGEKQLAARYLGALAQRGVEARLADGEECAIAGLRLLDDD
jgi:2-dehydro-3-deoxygalactonokinase